MGFRRRGSSGKGSELRELGLHDVCHCSACSGGGFAEAVGVAHCAAAAGVASLADGGVAQRVPRFILLE